MNLQIDASVEKYYMSQRSMLPSIVPFEYRSIPPESSSGSLFDVSTDKLLKRPISGRRGNISKNNLRLVLSIYMLFFETYASLRQLFNFPPISLKEKYVIPPQIGAPINGRIFATLRLKTALVISIANFWQT